MAIMQAQLEALNTMLDAVFPQPATRIDVYCSDCGTFMYWKDGQGVSGKSHGLCNDCKDDMMDEVRRGLTK
jgi:hypothetical protein